MFHNTSIAVSGLAVLHQPRSSSTSWNVGGKIKLVGYLMTNAGLEEGDRILASKAGGTNALISGRFERSGNWNKETLGRSIHKLVQAAPLAADKEIRASLLRFISAHGWKSQLKCMRQVLSDVELPSFHSPPFLYHVRTLVLALFPRWCWWFQSLLEDYRSPFCRAGCHVIGLNETVCVLRCLVYGAKHRGDLTLSIFFLFDSRRKGGRWNHEIHVFTEVGEKRRGIAVIFGMLWRLPGSAR